MASVKNHVDVLIFHTAICGIFGMEITMLTLNKELEETYVLLEEIGSGGGGTVFKAYHKRLQKEVVLKKIHNKLAKSSSINIRAEADILKNLKHEYLPQVLDFFELDGDVYTVMDFIPGQSFKGMLADGKKFTQSQILKWFDQLCQAVEQLHKQNPPIIHGDIKPDNIMLTPEDNICLIDFNVSGDMTDEDAAGYTPGYAAPEQMASFQERKKKIAVSNANRQVIETARLNAGYVQGADDTTQVDAGYAQGAGDTTQVDTGYAQGAGDITQVDAGYAQGADDTTQVDTGFSHNTGDTTQIGVDTTVNAVYEEAAASDELSGIAAAVSNQLNGIAASGASLNGGQKGSGKIHMDTRSDIYSIGATIYHLITGEKPAVGYVKPVTEFPVKIEESLAFVIMKCLQQDPGRRYQSIQELHKAVLGVHTSSRAYRRLVRRQLIARIVLLVGIAGFSLLASSGLKRMEVEKQNKYTHYVEQEKQARENQNYDDTENWYQKAVALYPNRSEAYFEKLYSLYTQKKYEDAVIFVNNVVLNSGCEEKDLANIYFVCGNCHFEMEQYEDAAEALRASISINTNNSQAYRDYAVTLARLDRIKEAQKQLEIAIERGLGEDEIYYIQGEISLALEEFDEAWKEFKSCIELSKDDYIKMRSYIMCSRILDEKGKSADLLRQNAELLKEASTALTNEYKSVILDKLAQTYSELANASQDGSYDMEAISVFDEIINYGWATYTTYNNKAVIYQKNKMYAEENDTLQTMLNLYGSNYNTYKRLAFMEASRQLELTNENRNYTLFGEYYQKAVQLYHEQLSNNRTDPEMTTLDNLYQQAVSGGWIG